MTDCGQIPDQLTQQQNELARINTLLENPEQACAGLTDDECVIYIKNLEKQQGSVSRNISILQNQLSICGTWAINFQGEIDNYTGQFTIISWNSAESWNGTMLLSDMSQSTSISGVYPTVTANGIRFTRPLPDGSVQNYSGSVQPPMMQGNGVVDPPPGQVGPMPVFNWTAQKQ